jgi:hypothetical protein
MALIDSNALKGLGLFALGFVLCWVFLGDSNLRLTYGLTGTPKNCRALIAANIDGWRSNAYTSEAVLNSIDRYCGRSGSNWGR